jgi:ABC-type dipeptide/oligopeptide/nickel transport system permease component
MRLARALGVRIGLGMLSLLFISFVTFLSTVLAPGDPAQTLAGEKATPATVMRLRHEMGLDLPWPERYVRYLADVAHGDFGRSFYGTQEPVRSILGRELPMTFRLSLIAILLASLFGVVLGTIAGVYRDRWPDRAVLFFSTLGVTAPNFVLGPLLVWVFYLKLNNLPERWDGRLPLPEWEYFILPVTILAMRPGAMLTRLTRASMIETLQQEFIRTAVAKGVPRGRLILVHGLRNAILPVVTAIGTNAGYLLTGSFVVETMFSMPGIGQETIESITKRDYPVIQACILVTGFLFIAINLLVDMILPVLDPRIRESQV